ncbi:MAG: prepilin peptidase [Candidatus Peribacteraceae bacterium]|nr:prepilin peptidase [Candidatus Peribacteraceae bacterium]
MALGIVLFALAGLAFGSFGNVLIYRIHSDKPITGRSMCPSCHRTLSWFELFPVISFLVLGGTCRTCHHRISLRYPFVELGSALLFVFAFTLHPADPVAALLAAFILYFLFLACVFDATYQQIPDVFTVFISIFAAISIVTSGEWVSSVCGALVMLAWFGGQWLISRKAVGTGDIFLAAVLGLYLGFRSAVMTIVFSYMAGAIILVVMILSKKIRLKQQRIAYVPFLALGVLLTLLGVGDAYMRVIGL